MKRMMPKTIRGKIIACTGAFTVIIAAITVTICFCVFQTFLIRNQIQSAEYNLQVVSHNVSTNMDSIINFNEWCTSNPDISRYLDAFKNQTKMPSISSENSYLRMVALSAYERLKEEYRNTNSHNYITRVIVSPLNCRNYLQISDTASSLTPDAADIIHYTDFFEDIYNAKGYLWPGLVKDPFSTSETKKILPIIRPVYNQYNSEIVGWTYFAISDQLISSYLNSFPLEEDSHLYITIGGHSYQYVNGGFTEDPLLCESLRDISINTINSQASLVKLPDGSKRRMVTSPLNENGWTISLVLSEKNYNMQKHVYLLLIAVIAVTIFLMAFLLIYLLNKAISQPVQKLRGTIDRISHGNFARDPSIEWEDELGVIGRGINQMSENVVTLMDKRVDDEKQKKDLEYQILQSQINPHFLYNTLNSIKWMATIQNAPGIAEMTTSLARLMKNISKGTASLIPLKEELELVKDYFLIQQYRYGGSISIEYQIESEDLYQCRLHRFTLQPMVENALFHGIEPKGCAGKIIIKAEKAGGPGSSPALKISVTDNGVGMTEEAISKVLAGGASPSADFFKQVGIGNVNKRIQYDFGPDYGIQIESRLGEYTTVSIILPYSIAEAEQGKGGIQ
ncbi:HAMP domain-containing protein [Clostridium sp. MCC353]|nr:HAMP domain-containing protein [Clostridium sp. MCC353]